MLMLLGFLIGLPAWSLTLTEISDLALENSQFLKAREMEQRALLFDAEVRSKWLNPQLIGQIGGLRSGEMSGATVEVSLLQAIPLSNKLSLKRELALEAAKSQKLRTTAFTNWVVHQALLAAWRVYVHRSS